MKEDKLLKMRPDAHLYATVPRMHFSVLPVLWPRISGRPRTWDSRIPVLTNNAGIMPIFPLRFVGEISPRYIGTAVENMPA